MSEPITRTEAAFVFVAVVLHIGALGATRLFPDKNLLHEREGRVNTPFDVELIEEPRVEKEEKPFERSPELPAIATVPTNKVELDRPDHTPNQRRADSSSSRSSDTGSTADPGGEPTGPGPQVTGPGESDWSAPGEDSPPAGLFGPRGISDLARRIAIANAQAPAAPTETPKMAKVSRDKANEVIKDELRKKDKALGLDLPAAGTIASLIRSAVQSSDAPATTTATFAVALGPGGKVQSVKVVSNSSGNAATWSGIAAVVKGALAGQKLTLTEDYAKGAMVVVHIKSKMQMPSGAEVDAGIKLSLTQNFDVADIGASPVRAVSVAGFSATPVK